MALFEGSLGALRTVAPSYLVISDLAGIFVAICNMKVGRQEGEAECLCGFLLLKNSISFHHNGTGTCKYESPAIVNKLVQVLSSEE